uniref:Uncharacterized protein n=1 Tax=Anguilla anguilla TaxID=7936 RepID=A0A0E9T2L3_ANGAN
MGALLSQTSGKAPSGQSALLLWWSLLFFHIIHFVFVLHCDLQVQLLCVLKMFQKNSRTRASKPYVPPTCFPPSTKRLIFPLCF